MTVHDPENKSLTPLERLPRFEPRADGRLLVRAPAKINLNLLVGPCREDGFHPLDSIVSKISLYDELTLSSRGDTLITLQCRNVECGPDGENLAYRAAMMLAEGRDVRGVDILLNKRIGAGKGLGGGSSDAAAVLLGLNQLWELSLGDGELLEIAAELGSDVPLFLAGASSRMTGRGEILAPTSVHDFVAVIIQGFSTGDSTGDSSGSIHKELFCPTASVYREYDKAPVEIGEQLCLQEVADCPPSAWRGRLRNDLAAGAFAVCPELRQLRDTIQAATDIPVMVTGSGSGLVVLCDDEAEAAGMVTSLDADLVSMCVIAGCNGW